LAALPVHGASVRSQTVEGNDAVRQLCDDTSNFLVASGAKFTLPPLVDGNLPAGSFRVPSPLISVVSCILRLAATIHSRNRFVLWVKQSGMERVANQEWIKEMGKGMG
jgi:hypothetical protein